jgi:hypothetical protein
MLTDVERDEDEDDVVLVSPQYGLCPDCTRGGYDVLPGGSNPPPNTGSIMPRDFEDLTRKPYDAVERFSKIPSSSLRPASPSKLGPSRLPSDTYNPGASRRPPQSAAKSYLGQAASKYSTQAPSKYVGTSQVPSPSQIARESHRPLQSQVSRESQRPSQSQTPKEPHQPSPSQAPRESQRSSYSAPAVSSVKSPTAIYNHISKVASTKAAPSGSRFYGRTQAPPADEEAPDLEVLLNSETITPSSKHPDEPLSPPGATVFPGKSFAPRRASSASKQSQVPARSKISSGTYLPRSVISRDSEMTSPSNIASASLVPKSEVSGQTSQSKIATASTVSKYSQAPLSRPPQARQSALLSYPSQFAPKKPAAAMSPAELLKRGPPKNVNASAFYDNLDGEDARARAEGRGQSSPPFGSAAPKSSASKG